jgi:hypothetical protein
MTQSCATCRHWSGLGSYRCALSVGKTLPFMGYHGGLCGRWVAHD